MSISPIGSSANVLLSNTIKPQQAATAPDGDPTAVEKSESASKQQVEKANGGITPSASVISASKTTPGSVNKLV